MSKSKLDLTEEEINKLKIYADYLFFDQYKDMASYPRFEECFGGLIKDKNISLETVYQEMCGPKRKYITFRRFIKCYLNYKENKVSADTQNFFQLFFNEALKNEIGSIGKKETEGTKFETKEGKKKKSISQFSVITDINKEKIQGFQIMYDDFFKYDLFPTNEENEEGKKLFIPLEINLPRLNFEDVNEFPDINLRDGITHILGTIDEKITFLGFKCRSGKTSYIGNNPKGQLFFFGEYKKQLQSLKIEIKDNEINYFEPYFAEVQRVNPFIDIEINQKFLDDDKPIYEEELLEKMEDEEEIDKHVFQPLVSDYFFFDPRFFDEIKGQTYKDIGHLKERYWYCAPGKGKKAQDFKFSRQDIMKEAIERYNEIINNFNLIGKKIKSDLGIITEKILNDIKNINPEELFGDKSIVDFLFNKENFGNLVKKVGDRISENFKELMKTEPTKLKTGRRKIGSKEEEKKENEIKNEHEGLKEEKPQLLKAGGIGRLKKQQYIPNKGYGFTSPNELQNYFGQVLSEFSNMWNPISQNNKNTGFGFFNQPMSQIFKNPMSIFQGYNNYSDYDNYDNYGQKRLTNEEKRQLEIQTQEKWKNISKKLIRTSPALILKQIGAVVRALRYLKLEEQGNSSIYTMDEKVRIYELLNDNAHIVNMLTKAHEESLKIEAERKKKEEEDKLLIQMKEEEEKRKEEEKKKLEDEIKRKEEENKISAQKYILEENEKKREEEEKKIQEEIKKEKDRRKKRELESQEKKLKEESEKARKDEERKMKRLEQEQKKLEDKKKKETQQKIEEMKKNEEEEKKRKKELEEKEQKPTIKIEVEPPKEEEKKEEPKKEEEKKEEEKKEEPKKIEEPEKKEEPKKEETGSRRRRTREPEKKEEPKKEEPKKEEPKKEETGSRRRRTREPEKKEEPKKEEPKKEEESKKEETGSRRRRTREPEKKEEPKKEEPKKEEESKKEEHKKEEPKEEKKEEENKPKKILSTDSLPELEAKLAQLEKMIPVASTEEEPKLQQLYNQLLKDKNSIIEALNEEQKKKIEQSLNYDPNEDLKKEIEMRERLKEEENKKIEEARQLEEQKIKEKTNIVSFTNTEIPKDTPIYKKQKLGKKGELWNDDIFKPIKETLCPVDNYGRWQRPPDVHPNDLENWEYINWARAENIFNSQNYQVFYDGIINDDIIQGTLGDCYFLSAIGALCKFPKLVEKLFYIKEKCVEHCYGCYFRIGGVWKLILIDDYFPCYGRYGLNFAFSYTNGNEIWVVLIEKAWAKLNGSYIKVIGGEPHEVFDHITNAYSEKFLIGKIDNEALWRHLKDSEEKGFIMTAGTSTDTYNLDIEEKGLVPGHAYTILKVKEIDYRGYPVRLLKLRNPWGNTEWSGNWSDGSLLWTEELKKELTIEKKDEGIFWIAYNDFLTYFIIGGICHLYEDFVYTYKHYNKEIIKQGPLVNKLICENDDNHCYITIHQKNPRLVLKDNTYQKTSLHYLLLIDENNNFVGGNNNNQKNCTIDVVLKKGTYYLISDINYRYTGDNFHGHTISCYSKYAVGIEQETKIDLQKSIRDAINDYAHKYITPQSYAGGKIYQSKRTINTEFPFTFILFDNSDGINEVTLTDTMNFRNEKCGDFYLEKDGKDKVNSITKVIGPDESALFIHMPYAFSSVFSYSLRSSARPTSKKKKTEEKKEEEKKEEKKEKEKLKEPVKDDKNKDKNAKGINYEEEVFNQSGEPIDKDATLKQYILSIDDKYYIGLENSGSPLRMKLVLTGLNEINNPFKNEIPFRIGSKSKKVFTVKAIDPNDEDISFLFDLA